MNNSNCILDIPYSDNTILTFGKYKFTRLCNVPKEYLIRIYEKNNCPDKKLYEWINNNIHRITNGLDAKPVKKICYKITYESENAAKSHLKSIKNNSDTNRSIIPVRAYECPLCSGWHLTSQEKHI